MWESERRKVRTRNLVILAVLAVIIVGLVVSYRHVQNQIAAEDAKLNEASNSQQQELSDARQESLEAVLQAYEVDLQTVKDYMPGIICWGDSLTTGSSGNLSYPYVLQKLINTYMCDIYDFRSSISSIEDYTKLRDSDFKVSIPVVNMGAGQENSATILGRSGVAPFVVKADFEIPAETVAVPITFTAANGATVAPLIAGNEGVNPVTIDGVEGTLSIVTASAGWKQYKYEFTRLTAGDPVSVKKGTEIFPAVADEYTDYIHVVWIGTYDNYRKPEELVQDVRKILERQTGNTERYLVLGPCTYGGSWKQVNAANLDAIDSAMLQAFGSRYVNVRKYLIEDGLRDAGVTPTREDATNLSKGFVPYSFQSNASGADLNGMAYALVGKLVYERMERLGYFLEIREELNLDKTTQEILKNDPTYFEKALRYK